jgi:hypothetical protein
MVASGVGALAVIPVLQVAIDEVQVSFRDDHHSIESFVLKSLDDSLDMSPQVRSTHGHLGDIETL